jgi:UDP-GlcNAc:undecaprenyl-phosphate GlcNAc-1-phosphate transferase
MDWRPALLLPAIAVIAWALTVAAERLARALNLVDAPGGPLKIHARATPRFGGFAVIVSLWLVYLSGSVTGLGVFTAEQLSVASLLFALGTWDDFKPRSAALRLILQIMIFAISWNLGVRVAFTGVEWLDFALSLLCFVAVVNAVNFYDGMDGLLALTAVCALGVWGAVAAEHELAWLPSAASAAILLGFLPRNWHPARTFLGDGGSFVVGFLFYLVFTAPRGECSLLGFWVCAVPVCDAVAATLDRMQRHGNVFAGDRDHLYDILGRLGLSVSQVALSLGLLAAITARSAQLIARVSHIGGALMTVALYALLTLGILAMRRRFRIDARSGPESR